MRISTALSLLASTVSIVAPIVNASPLEARHTHRAPHFVAYWDNWLNGENGPPNPATLNGFNTIMLAFLVGSGPLDQAKAWTQLSAGTRNSIKDKYWDQTILIMVSAFGATEQPTTQGLNPTSTAQSMAKFVKEYNLDGIDVDYEDFTAMNAANGKAENWLITFTKVLRQNLPYPYSITHAPLAPWFSPIYTAGAYTKVHKEVGNLIDFYNVQFYNQGASEYTTCAGLLTTSGAPYTNTAVFQIHSHAGVPLDKIVIGKPGKTSDATTGYMSTSTLHTCITQAKSKGWSGGVMVWEFPDVGNDWIKAVRGSTFPLGSKS